MDVPNQASARPGGRSTAMAAFAAVTVLFFAWGFITSLIDPLVAAVKGIFTLSDAEAQLSAFAFFIAYGVMSFPAAALIARFHSVPSILTALATMVAGCLVMLAAANLAVYPLVLAGLFMLAAGITILQVAANPLATALGDPRRSHFRLTFSQTFNSFGTFLGPLVGAHLCLEGVEVKEGSVVTDAARAQALAGIDSAYFWICGLILALLIFFWVSRRIVDAAVPPAPVGARAGMGELVSEAFASRWACLGALAIFLYVGAEVAIGSATVALPSRGLGPGPAKVAIRPESLLLSDEAHPAALAGQVRKCAYLGNHLDIMVATEVGELFVIRYGAREMLEAGRPVWLSFASHGVMLIPPG